MSAFASSDDYKSDDDNTTKSYVNKLKEKIQTTKKAKELEKKTKEIEKEENHNTTNE